MQYEQAKTLLEQLRGVTFAGIDTATVPVLKGGKRNPFQGKLQKLAFGAQVILFGSPGYEAKVKRHLEAEGKDPESFKAGALPWGAHEQGTPFIVNKGEHYLQVVYIRGPKLVQYMATDTIRNDFDLIAYNKGDIVPKSNILGINERSGSEHQNLESEVIVRAYKLSSIVSLRAFHEELT